MPPSRSSIRLDELLVKQGLAASRAQAKALILAGRVRHGTRVLDKAGRTHPPDTVLTLDNPPRFVSRGGEKLEGALHEFGIDPRGLEILDVGASTGGFTDCLLQQGAIAATCVDVGRAQLHGKLLGDPRVTNLERVNARRLRPEKLPRPSYPLIVMDLSFISLRLVLPSVWSVLEPGGTLLALVKPQFEARKEEVDRGKGIVRDPEIRRRCLDEIRAFASDHLEGAREIGWMESVLAGTDGNLEYFLALGREQP